MPKKLSRRLVGCFAIELLFAAGLLAADSDYQAGTAAAGKVKALALEDRRGNRAVFATAEFRMSQSVSDFIAAQVLRAYGVDRAALLLHSAGQGDPAPDDAVAVIGAALGALQPAVARASGGAVSITASDGRCRARLARWRSSSAGQGNPCARPSAPHSKSSTHRTHSSRAAIPSAPTPCKPSRWASSS